MSVGADLLKLPFAGKVVLIYEVADAAQRFIAAPAWDEKANIFAQELGGIPVGFLFEATLGNIPGAHQFLESANGVGGAAVGFSAHKFYVKSISPAIGSIGQEIVRVAMDLLESVDIRSLPSPAD